MGEANRPFVCVFKSDLSKDRAGFAAGETHEEARDRFIKTRRQPSSKQLAYSIPLISVTIGDETRLYGAEGDGFPEFNRDGVSLAATLAK